MKHFIMNHSTIQHNGSRADLKEGESIFTTARVGDDGKLLTPRVVVSKNGVKPPQ